MNNDTCLNDGCDTKAAKKCAGYCEECWGEALDRQFGNIAWTKRGSRKWAEDSFWANAVTGEGCWGWLGKTANGYGRVSVEGKSVPAHRFSYELANGEISDGMFIDHLCHNRACTNPEHLREVTPKQNTEHRIGKNPNNTSGRHGVHWNKASGKWHATVHAGDKVHFAGSYHDLDEAAEAARLKRLELFTHNDRDQRAS